MIIDSHIHHYPVEVVRNPLGWAQAQREPLWGVMHRPRGEGGGVSGWADESQLLAAMDAGGVDRALILGWYWERQETCALANDWQLKWVQLYHERLSAFASVQPLAGELAFDAVRRAVDAGLCGIGECFPAAQRFTRDHPTWLKILAWAEGAGIPVTMHVTEPVGQPYPGRVASRLADYLWTAQQFPRLKLILAHWGGGLPFYMLNAFCRRRLAQVYYDTAASPLIYDSAVFSVLVGIIGADRVLYGSDFPLRLYPRLQREPDFFRFIQAIKQTALSVPEQRKILGNNARQLFELG